MPESCVEIRHAILAKFHKPFFSNFSVVAKGLGFEAFAAGRFFLQEVPESCVEIRHAILAKFHKPFFSNFSVVAKGLGFEAFTWKVFVGSARVLRRSSTRDRCKVS